MEVPLLDLREQYKTIREEVRRVLDEVCDAQQFILGPRVEQLEKEIAAYCGVRDACGVSSGSDALLMCLMLEGIGHGDEVITSPYTFFATAGAIARVGATPVFADIDPATFNLAPAAIQNRITSRTKAIIPVHLFGQTADLDPILEIARRNRILVIEDACQAIGAEYKGKRAGSLGDYGCFSFFPSKNLGGFGDGGMVVANDPARVEQLKLFRNHGMKPKYFHHCVGGNFRLDALQAAVLSIKLKHLDEWTARRQANAAHYTALFAASPAAARVVVPLTVPTTTRHIFNQYCIRLPSDRRQPVWDGLKTAKVGCEVYYPIPLHLQPCFARLGAAKGDFPHSERAAEETLALPIYPETTAAQREFVVEMIGKLL